MKNFLLLVFIFCALNGHSQDQLNDYKFIIVPKKFSCFKKQNAHKTSTLIKFLFVQEGFDVHYEGDLPSDLMIDRCLGLLVDLNDGSSMFTTKTSMVLKDCNSNVVLETMEGISKKKDFKAAYQETIEEAFVSIKGMNYSYMPKEIQEEPIASIKDKEAKKERKEKEATVVVPVENVESEELEVIPEKVDAIKTVNPENKADTKKAMVNGDDLLYAQVIPNGYQLIDSAPKVRMKLFNTSKPDYFMAKKGDVNGVVFKQDGTWVFEYFENDAPKKEELKIKF